MSNEQILVALKTGENRGVIRELARELGMPYTTVYGAVHRGDPEMLKRCADMVSSRRQEREEANRRIAAALAPSNPGGPQ